MSFLRSRPHRIIPLGLRLALRRAPAIARWWWRAPRHPRQPALDHLVASRESPLRRAKITYSEALQAGKERNVALASEALDGILLAPGQSLSFCEAVGPPLSSRGFLPGPELHDGRLAEGIGGGLCQAANLLYYLAAHAGLEILERHRHALDLFPDDGRDVPFGLGATVFWPHRDLVVRNPHDTDLHLSMSCRDGAVSGSLTSRRPLRCRYTIEEREHRFSRRGEEIYRSNQIVRVATAQDGARREELLASCSARVLYPVSPDQIAKEAP